MSQVRKSWHGGKPGRGIRSTTTRRVHDSGRLSRRRLLQVAGGGAIAAVGATALYEGLALVAPHPATGRRGPRGGYPAGQYQVADYGVRVQPDPESAVVVSIPPVWNLVITATLTRALASVSNSVWRLRCAPSRRPIPTALRECSRSSPMACPISTPMYARRSLRRIYRAWPIRPTLADAKGAPVLLDAIRFPSDPSSTVVGGQRHCLSSAFGYAGPPAGCPARPL